MQVPDHTIYRYFTAPVNDQWNYLLATMWDQMIHLVVTLGGRLDERRLCRACDLVIETEPLLSTRFVDDPCPCWETLPFLCRESVFSMVACSNRVTALRKALPSGTDTAKGPQVHFTLIRGDAADSLVLSVNHSVSDACGVRYLCGLLARAYRGLERDLGFSLPARLPQDRSFHPFISSLSPDDRDAARESCGEQSAVWAIPCHRGVQGRPAFCSREIGPQVLLKAKAYSRSHKVTINDLLLAAFFASITREIPHLAGQHYPVLTSADLRRLARGWTPPAVANLSVAFEVWLPAASIQSPESLVREVHRVMDRKKRSFAVIGAAIRLEEAFSAGFSAVRTRLTELERPGRSEYSQKNPFFSNTGIIPPGCVNFGDVPTARAFLLPPVEYPPGFGIAASTFGNYLTLASGFCEGPLSTPMVERILLSMEEFLSVLPCK